jgi:hypothetical protein
MNYMYQSCPNTNYYFYKLFQKYRLDTGDGSRRSTYRPVNYVLIFWIGDALSMMGLSIYDRESLAVDSSSAIFESDILLANSSKLLREIHFALIFAQNVLTVCM